MIVNLLFKLADWLGFQHRDVFKNLFLEVCREHFEHTAKKAGWYEKNPGCMGMDDYGKGQFNGYCYALEELAMQFNFYDEYNKLADEYDYIRCRKKILYYNNPDATK